MAKTKKQLPPKYQVWINARKQFHLSHAQIQMARELGMNPKRFGGKANHKQERSKVPLPAFIEQRYERKFGKKQPDDVRSVEQRYKDKKQKQADRKARKQSEAECDVAPVVHDVDLSSAEASDAGASDAGAADEFPL